MCLLAERNQDQGLLVPGWALCGLLGQGGEGTAVSEHPVQPTRPTGEEVRAQRKGGMSPGSLCIEDTLHLSPKRPPQQSPSLCRHLPCQNSPRTAGQAVLEQQGWGRGELPPPAHWVPPWLPDRDQSSRPVGCHQPLPAAPPPSCPGGLRCRDTVLCRWPQSGRPLQQEGSSSPACSGPRSPAPSPRQEGHWQ